MSAPHHWTFFRAGGFDQVKIESGADLMNLDALDPKLWVALACPIEGLEIDRRTLALIDTDNDGRVRAPELIAAAKFATTQLKVPDDLMKGEATLALAAINDATVEGRTLQAAARQILINLGKADASSLSVEDVAEPVKLFADMPFNGDGVIVEESADDEPTRAVIRDIIACLGAELDRSGKPGIGQEKIDAFFAEARILDDWYVKAAADAGNIFPLGREATVAAAIAVRDLEAKVNDYFGRCRLAAFDPRATEPLNRSADEYLAVATRELSFSVEEIADFPLARVAPGRPLPLAGAVNPAHADALARLKDAAIVPLLGPRDELTEADWIALTARLGPFAAWTAGQADLRVEQLGDARVQEILTSAARETLTALVARDEALRDQAANLENVERLVRYHRDLKLICTNFVNFKGFYDGSADAIFQCGTLYLDQRSCRLCLRVADVAKHAVLAGLAGAYLAYVDCVRKATNEKMQIVAAFTAGDGDNLMVGRNGVFYDRGGLDWDATITKIIDNPISVRQAFWAPYKKFARLLDEQIAKRAKAADSDAQAQLSTTATTVVEVDRAKRAEPKKIDVGTLAALGVAVGALGTFLTAFVGYATGLFKLGFFATMLGAIGVICLISTPAVILAYMKLRKRNLGPMLDASGWAINARAKINVPFGATLTGVAKLPPGARRDFGDKYADKGPPWKRALALILLIYAGYRWTHGAWDRLLPERVRARTVLGAWAPAPPAPGPASSVPPAK